MAKQVQGNGELGKFSIPGSDGDSMPTERIPCILGTGRATQIDATAGLDKGTEWQATIHKACQQSATVKCFSSSNEDFLISDFFRLLDLPM